MKLKTSLFLTIFIFLNQLNAFSTDYYLKTGASDPTILSNWSLTLNGSGASPANFTTNNQIFNIVNNATVTQSAAWTVSGTGSKIIVGDGAAAITFNSTGVLTTPSIDVTNNATLKLGNASIPTLGTLSTGSTVNYSAGSGQGITATTYSNLTTSGSGTKSVTGTAVVNGVLTLNTTLTIASFATLTITNNIAGTASFLTGGVNSSLISNGTSALTIPSNIIFLKNLTVNNSGGCLLSGDLLINGILSLQSGNFTVGAHTFTFNTPSSLSITGGTLVTTSSSSLKIYSIVTLPSSVANLADLFIQASITLASNITVHGILTLNGGTFTNGAFLTMATGSSIIRNNGTITTEPNATTTYNLSYIAGTPGTTPTGPELPATTTKLNNLTILAGSSRQVNLNKNCKVNGNLNITTGLFGLSTFTLTLAGNFINSQANTNFVASTGTINFSGAGCTISTIDENEFNNITISGTLSAPTAFPLKLKGNFVNTGTFTHNNGIVKFSGTTTISGASTTSFYNVNILSGASLTGKSAGTFNVANNFNNDGTSFNGNNGIVGFTGSACTITGATTTTFASIAITGTLIAPSSLNLTGNFDNSGVISLTACTVNFSGAGNKDIKGTVVTTFSNINVSGGTLRVENVNANLTGTLTLSGTAIFDGDGSSNNRIFTLISDASGTARIATIPSTASVTGNITLQRYATGADPEWTLMGTPIKTRTLANWTANFPTSGFPGATGSAGGFVSIYSDNEALATSFDDPNRYVEPSSSADAITVGKGYWVYLGNSLGTSRNVTVSLTGNPQVNRQTSDAAFNFGVTRTGGSDPGWNLISNPFPSEIDWSSTTGWTKTNIDNTIYYYDATFGGDQYISYLDLGNGTGIAEDPSVNGLIASSQAVYVQATGASPVLRCDERVKPATHSSPNFHKTSSTSSLPLVRLKLTNGTLNSSTVVYMNASATPGFDQGYDSKDFTDTVASDNIDLSTKADSIYLSINGIPPVSSNISIPVRSLVGTSGYFSLFASTIDNVDQNICITLFDSLNSTYTNLRTDTLDVLLSDTLTQARFFLKFTYDNQVTFTQNIIQPTCADPSNRAVVTPAGIGPFNIIWKDANNNIIKNTMNVFASDTIDNLASGDYIVNVYNGSACGFATDVFSIDNVNQNNATFTSQNANCNGANNAQINAVPSGNAPYHYVWFDNSSNVIRETIGSNSSDALTNIGAGNYSVNISFNNGCPVSQSFTITEPSLPVASFINIDSVDINDADSILFVNNSTNADNYEWVISGDANTYTDNDLVYTFLTEGTYTIILTSADNNCNSSSVASNTVIVYAPVVTSANSNITVAGDDDIKLLSNLNDAQLQFNYSSDKPVFVTIYDALGQQLTHRLSVKPNNQIVNLDLGSASSQVLFINISGEEKNQTFKMFCK